MHAFREIFFHGRRFMILIPKLMNLLRLFLTAGRRWGLLGVLGAGFILGQGSAYLYAQVTANPLTVPPSLSLSRGSRKKSRKSKGKKSSMKRSGTGSLAFTGRQGIPWRRQKPARG